MILAAVPAYNESSSISEVIKELTQEVDEVVVVDDGSEDNTTDKALSAGAKVITHELNRGQGAALETARRYAAQEEFDFMVTFDGDGQFEVEDIQPAVSKLKNNQADVLLGSRFLNEDSTLPWSKQKILLPLASIIEYFFTGLNLSDVHNGFKIFSHEALSKIEITQDRMAHASEIPELIQHHQLDYVEFPVTVKYDDYGQDASAGVNIIKDLVLGKFVK
jgi:glycosyltransferase involved in cell wall biosynthesis